MFIFTLKLHTCFIKNPLAEKSQIQKKLYQVHFSNSVLQRTIFKPTYTLPFSRQISKYQNNSRKNQPNQNYNKTYARIFSSVLQTKHINILLGLQVAPNLIFRSLELACGNQIELNEIFPLIKILKYLLAFTALLCYSNSYLLLKCKAEFSKP